MNNFGGHQTPQFCTSFTIYFILKVTRTSLRTNTDNFKHRNSRIVILFWTLVRDTDRGHLKKLI